MRYPSHGDQGADHALVFSVSLISQDIIARTLSRLSVELFRRIYDRRVSIPSRGRQSREHHKNGYLVAARKTAIGNQPASSRLEPRPHRRHRAFRPHSNAASSNIVALGARQVSATAETRRAIDIYPSLSFPLLHLKFFYFFPCMRISPQLV